MPGLDDHTEVTSDLEPWEGPDQVDEPALDADATSVTRTPAPPVDPGASVPTPTRKRTAAGPDHYHLEAGTALGEYRIEGKIGQGGMGVVFSAVHPLIGKRAAIKILKKELCADPHTLERFVDEARVVNQIGHPNIVDVFAFGEMPDGRSYFVMEWLKGETLRARIARSRMGVTEVSQIVRQLARALEAAHEKGVIHRDLKPDNVFLVDVRDDRPTVKLLDFGIAKLARNDHRVEKTATGAIVGTPQYIAPEQAKGYAIDHRVDIYALGGMIFEMLTGQPPFVADNAMEMVAKHLMEAPVPPSQLAGVPPELDDLVLRMLAKTPDSRPPLAEVSDVLERLKERASTEGSGAQRASTSPVHADPPAMTGRSFPAAAPISQAIPQASRPPRTGLWVALAGVPLAGLAAFLIVSMLGGDGSPPPPPIVATPPPETPAPVAAVELEAPMTEVPVAVPPPADGELRLIIVGAKSPPEILIDGLPGATEQLVTPGVHDVEVRSRGMQPYRFRVEVESATATIRKIQLVPKEPRPRIDPPKPKDPPRPNLDDGELLAPGSLSPRR